MPVLGIVRSPSVEHGIAACELVTEHGGLGHTSAVYAQDETVIERFAEAIRTGRILVNAPTAVGALGGVYNALTPTFSLGCGTWGGSTTTDNVNYRNLLNIKAVSRRQAPPQWFRVPSDTYFNTGAIESLRQVPAAQVLIVTDADTEARGAVDEVRRHLGPRRRARVLRRGARARARPRSAPACRCSTRASADLVVAVGGGSVIDAAKAMRLFHEHPAALAARAGAAVPRRAQARRRIPADRPPRPPGRRADDRRHGLGGLARRGADRRRGARSRSSTTRSCPTWRSSSRA